MTQLRKIVFLLFVGIYLVVAPLTLLYALGYIFSPAEQTLLPTGLVSLETDPPGASVWLNGKPLEETTPLVLRNLKPGNYEIRLQGEGVHAWEKRIQVKPEQALRFEKIFLFPLSYEPEILSDFPIARMWEVPGGRKLLVHEGEEAARLHLFDPEAGRFQDLFSNKLYDQARVEDIRLDPTGEQAILTLRKGKLFLPFLIRWGDSIQTTSLADLLPGEARDFRWNPFEEHTLFYLNEGTLGRLDLARGILYPALAKRVRGYTIQERHLFVLDEKKRFLELNGKGKIRRILFDDPLRARVIFGSDPNEFYSIFFLPQEFLFFLPNDSIALFWSQSGRLLCNKLPYFLDEDVEALALASAQPRMAYRKGPELWIVDFEAERATAFFESGPTPRLLYKGEETLSQVAWFYEDRYLLFLDGNRLKVQGPEEEEATELFSVSEEVRQFTLDSRRGFVYFAEPQGNRLARVKLNRGTSLFAPPLLKDFVDEIRV